MAQDVRDAFYKTEDRTGDVLERSIIRWATTHPLG